MEEPVMKIPLRKGETIRSKHMTSTVKGEGDITEGRGGIPSRTDDGQAYAEGNSRASPRVWRYRLEKGSDLFMLYQDRRWIEVRRNVSLVAHIEGLTAAGK